MAIRHHSRQENGYIHWHDMISISLGRKLSAQSSSSGSSRHSSMHGSMGSFGNKNSSHVSLGDVSDVKSLTDPSPNVGGGKKKLNLRINIQDDQDWIQVLKNIIDQLYEILIGVQLLGLRRRRYHNTKRWRSRASNSVCIYTTVLRVYTIRYNLR